MSTKLSWIQVVEFTGLRRDAIKAECLLHFRNRVSAHILQRKFHELDVMERDQLSDYAIEKLNVMKSHFIEKYATHPDFEEAIAFYDNEITSRLNTKNQTFEQFVEKCPDYLMWNCCLYIPRWV